MVQPLELLGEELTDVGGQVIVAEAGVQDRGRRGVKNKRN